MEVKQQIICNQADLESAFENVLEAFLTKREKKDDLLSIEEVSKRLSVNRSTLWRWAKEEYLVPIKVGKKSLYREADVENLLNR